MNSKIALIVAAVVVALVLVIGRQGPSVSQTALTPSPGVGATMVAPPVASVAPVPVPVAAPAAPYAPAAPAGGEQPLPNYVPRKLKVFEGHWQGMDGRLMTGELARKLNFPQGVQGVLLGEVTLNAAFSGLLGGDVVVRVDDTPVTDMESFQAASRLVANRNEARIAVLRKDDRPGPPVVRKLTVALRVEEGGLGFVQLEGAPMILAGDPRPHGYRGPCTECHPIGQGFELTPDPDLISLPPPAISRDVATSGVSPHEVRGPCEACHVIK
uniref:Magnetosome protein n=1 Tax=alpha proteobacterium UT-2 TaxID=1008135 RepID=G9HWD6_9PROT|nr:magnetosome protein [alpha proteobacterium UT-2]